MHISVVEDEELCAIPLYAVSDIWHTAWIIAMTEKRLWRCFA